MQNRRKKKPILSYKMCLVCINYFFIKYHLFYRQYCYSDFSVDGSSDEYLPDSSDDSEDSNASYIETVRISRQSHVDSNGSPVPGTSKDFHSDLISPVASKNTDGPNSSNRQHVTAEDTLFPDKAFQNTSPRSHIENVKIASVKKKLFKLPEKTTRKRERRPETWKRKKAAICREHGQAYTSQKGTKMSAKSPEFGSLCKKQKCKRGCNDHFDERAREEIFRKYYALDINAKNAVLFKSISIKPVRRHRKNITRPKTSSFTYSVTYNKTVRTVCKTAFCSLYQLSNKKVQIIQRKLNSGTSAPTPDKRGRHDSRPHKIEKVVIDKIKVHISSFPSEQSHYSRNKNGNKKYLSPLLNISKMHNLYLEKCKNESLEKKFFVTKSFYSNIFATHFNLSFGLPRSDTCSTCDAGLNTEEHQENYRYAFELQKLDRQYSRDNDGVCYLTMDLQQTMPLPRLTTSKAFYLRQMWFYNFGVHTITSSGDRAYFFTWTEDIATKGSLEVASSLHTFVQLLNSRESKIKHLIIWSDSCSGQNKNFILICLYQYLIYKGYVQMIDHKFPEVGHSFLDSDRDFGRIEKKTKKNRNSLHCRPISGDNKVIK